MHRFLAVLAAIFLFQAMWAGLAAGATVLELDPTQYTQVRGYRYQESRRFEGGWNRGVDAVAMGGVVRSPVAGQVRFAGTVAGRGVVTLDAAVDGEAVVVTFTGVEARTVRVGSGVAAGDSLGHGMFVHVGVYDPDRRSRYLPVVVRKRAAANSHGAGAADRSAGGTVADGMSRRLRDAIRGTAEAEGATSAASASVASPNSRGVGMSRVQRFADSVRAFVVGRVRSAGIERHGNYERGVAVSIGSTLGSTPVRVANENASNSFFGTAVDIASSSGSHGVVGAHEASIDVDTATRIDGRPGARSDDARVYGAAVQTSVRARRPSDDQAGAVRMRSMDPADQRDEDQSDDARRSRIPMIVGVGMTGGALGLLLWRRRRRGRRTPVRNRVVVHAPLAPMLPRRASPPRLPPPMPFAEQIADDDVCDAASSHDVEPRPPATVSG